MKIHINHLTLTQLLVLQVLAQSVLWAVGLSLQEAAIAVTLASVLAPLYSRRARAVYRHAFSLAPR